jgi:hypothetical protein
VQVFNDSVNFSIGQLITLRGHLPPHTQFSVDYPIMDLLVRMMKSVLGRIKGWRI